MAKVENGWFSEINDLWYGQAMSFEVEEVLYHQKSKYQDILIFKSKSHGNVLVLDGCVQCTDRDEFTYQEMITYLPLSSHPNPKKVLVIGAGDGGVIREIAKHPAVESIVQCEIDEDVINMSKKYLPNMSCGFDSPKHKLHVGCGKEFMRQHQGEFDVIITDSSDPIGPAATLFEKDYYELMKSALKPDGLLCSQGECPWLDSEFIKNMLEFCKPLFPAVQYAYANVPTYPCGQIGFLMCSKNSATQFNQPFTKFTNEQFSSFNFKLYNPEVHEAGFVVPQFFKKKTKDFNKTSNGKPLRWFWEKIKNAPGQSFGLVTEEVLFQENVNNQDIFVFNNFIYGNVLTVNGLIQYTEKDISFCQESLVHLSMNCHPEPKKVLILGGVSGGTVLEAAKHQSVETIVYCENNKELFEISKKYFPHLSVGYSIPKLQKIHIGDYFEYLGQHRQEFDVVITVPRQTFLNPEASKLLKDALKPNGIVISQAPTFWLELDNILKLVKHDRTLFPTVAVACSYIPTCPYGQATFVLRSLNPDTPFENPVKQLPDDELAKLQFYHPKLHKACFALPEFVKKALET